MTLVLGLILLIPLGWHAPRLGHRWAGGKGAVLGAVAALALGFGVIFALAQAVAAAGGTEPRLAFESGFNAWKLLILLAPASAIHVRRQARQARQAPGAGNGGAETPAAPTRRRPGGAGDGEADGAGAGDGP